MKIAGPRALIVVLIAVIFSSCGSRAPAQPTGTAPVPYAASSPTTSPASPVGLQVVYPKYGDLWVWSAGATRQLTTAGNVSGVLLSADGSKAAFTRRLNDSVYELWVINLDGSGQRMLVSSGDLDRLGKVSDTREVRQSGSTIMFCSLAWVPGSYTLAFGTFRSVKYDGIIFHDDLNLVNAETGELHTLLTPGSAGNFIYSPDASMIAIFTQQHLSIVDADGSHRRDSLLEYHAPTLGEAHYFPQVVWSPGGQYLLAALPPEDPLDSLPNTLWRVPVDGSSAVQLGSTAAPVLPGHSVHFSPSLLYLAYTAQIPGGYTGIHIANVDGTHDRLVQQGEMVYFWSWSPGGQHYIYYSQPQPDAWYIGDLQGNSTRLDYLPVETRVEWVSSQSLLQYVRCTDQDCKYELRLASLQNGMVVIDRTSSSPWFDFIRP